MQRRERGGGQALCPALDRIVENRWRFSHTRVFFSVMFPLFLISHQLTHDLCTCMPMLHNLSLDGQVAVVVGGIAEMFMVSKNTENIYLKKRKNFTRLAVEVRLVLEPQQD